MTEQNLDKIEQLITQLPSGQWLPGDGDGGLSLISLNHPRFEALISPQGAQILTFTPRGDQPWLWLSPTAKLHEGAAIRGGIPLCLPWFGVNRYQADLPKHGVARTRQWQCLAASEDADGVTLSWQLTHQADDLFRHDFTAELTMRLSDELTLTLQMTHLGEIAAPYSFAFHTYFATDAEEATVLGLEGRTYLDNTQGLVPVEQQDAVTFNGEVDRVYATTTEPQILEGTLPLSVSGSDCPTCIVWNPGKTLAAQMDDVGEAWKAFICVERGAAFDDEIELSPGQRVTTQMHITKPLHD